MISLSGKSSSILAALAASLVFFLVAPAQAAFTLSGEFEQGGIVIGQAVPGSQVTLDGEALQISERGIFVFGFDRDAKPDHVLTVTPPEGTTETRDLTVAARDYNIQRIDGLPPKYVTPPEETLARIRREAKQKRAARPSDTDETWFTEQFIWPTKGRISGVYGSQRVYNGKPGRPHYGVDVAAPTGTPVVAPATGIVTLAEPDMYYEGGLVFIDHGQGLISILMHMDTVTVQAGEKVERGDQVGTVGAGGRSTGPHLDWRMYWREAHVDPTQLVPPME